MKSINVPSERVVKFLRYLSSRMFRMLPEMLSLHVMTFFGGVARGKDDARLHMLVFARGPK
jgi:hypothetical protein